MCIRDRGWRFTGHPGGFALVEVLDRGGKDIQMGPEHVGANTQAEEIPDVASVGEFGLEFGDRLECGDKLNMQGQ